MGSEVVQQSLVTIHVKLGKCIDGSKHLYSWHNAVGHFYILGFSSPCLAALSFLSFSIHGIHNIVNMVYSPCDGRIRLGSFSKQHSSSRFPNLTTNPSTRAK